jgi:type II secretory pathway component PulJ
MANNFKGCEPQPMSLNDERLESPFDLNLTQLAKHEKSIWKKMHLWLKFEHITRLWHQRLGVNACSLVLVLKVELVVDGEPKILYEGFY